MNTHEQNIKYLEQRVSELRQEVERLKNKNTKQSKGVKTIEEYRKSYIRWLEFEAFDGVDKHEKDAEWFRLGAGLMFNLLMPDIIELRQEVEKLKENINMFEGGFKGACPTCEHVGVLNIDLQKEVEKLKEETR